MKKVLAFFGAFNPPTNAHVKVAENAMKKTGRDGVIFVPSKQEYIANVQGKDFAFSDHARWDMLCRIALQRPGLGCSDHELRSEKQLRTYESLCMIRQMGYDPTLLVGSDVLFDMEKHWKNVDKIANEFGIVVTDRYGNGRSVRKEIDGNPFFAPFKDRITVLGQPACEYMSSSYARAALRGYMAFVGNIKSSMPEEILESVIYYGEKEGMI